VVGFRWRNVTKCFSVIEKLRSVLLNGDWMEETPLGHAEWISCGVLAIKKRWRTAFFTNDIEKNYLEAKTIASKRLTNGNFGRTFKM
jgi:iron complex transport system substrate-binding protein